MDLEKLKYPIGIFVQLETITEREIAEAIVTLKNFPDLLRTETQNLSAEELQWKYRPNGWSIAQVVHHCADSHLNSYLRFKLALTEDLPVIKPYREDLWADLPDSTILDISVSLHLLKSLHERWVFLLENFTKNDWEKQFIHPDSNKKISLKENVMIYDWHCKHHLAHVKQAKQLEFA